MNKFQKYAFVFIGGFIFSSCNNKANIPYSQCECFENYYDIKKGTYDDKLIRGHFMRKNDIRKNMKDKTTELVQYVYLNKEDRKVRNQCRRKYGKEVEQFGECE